MIDLYLFNTVINTIWYIFTILFVLYRFTSFFSYIYNFLRFCTNLWTWIRWGWNEIVAFVRRKQGYILIDSENPQDTEYLLPGRNKSNARGNWWTRFKQSGIHLYHRAYTWMFDRPHPQRRPQTTDILLSQSEYLGQGNETNNSGISSRAQDERYFDHHLSQLCSDSTFSFPPSRTTPESYYSPFIPTSSLPFAAMNDNSNHIQDTQDKLDEQYNKTSENSIYQSLFSPNKTQNQSNSCSNNSETQLDISLHNPLLSSSIFHPVPLDQPQTEANNYNNFNSSMMFNSEFIKTNFSKSSSNDTAQVSVGNVTQSITESDMQNSNTEFETGTHTTVNPININKPSQPHKQLRHISQSFVPQGPMHPLSDSFDEDIVQNPYI